jgi:hypothetical protein
MLLALVKLGQEEMEFTTCKGDRLQLGQVKAFRVRCCLGWSGLDQTSCSLRSNSRARLPASGRFVPGAFRLPQPRFSVRDSDSAHRGKHLAPQ